MSLEKSSVVCTHGNGFRCRTCWPSQAYNPPPLWEYVPPTEPTIATFPCNSVWELDLHNANDLKMGTPRPGAEDALKVRSLGLTPERT